jgi:hypothetical protein
MRKMLEKAIQGKTRPVDVNLAQLAIEIRVFVDEPDLETISASEQLPNFN